MREVSIDDFWLDYRFTARKPDELAVEVKLPTLLKNTVSSFAAMTRTTLDLAKVNAAVRLDMEGKVCKKARLAMGAVAPTTIRLRKTEKFLEDVEINQDVLMSVEKSVPTEITPIDDVRSTAEYRKNVSGILVKRAIQEACNAF